MASTPETLVGIGEAARKLGVSTTTIRNWEEQGAIVAGMRLASSGHRVWRAADLDAVAAARPGRRPVRLNADEAAELATA